MLRPSALIAVAGLALLAALNARADETFPVAHEEPISVRILNGKDGKPLPHAHLLLIAGYDPEELKMQTWQEETLTDEQGTARLSQQFANLPFLQVWVLKQKTCQSNPRGESFSVERIRRDGLSTPNRCGIATATATPGVFTVFVKGKIAPPKPAAPEAAPPAAVPARPAADLAPAVIPAASSTTASEAPAAALPAPVKTPQPASSSAAAAPAPPAVSVAPAAPTKASTPAATTPAVSSSPVSVPAPPSPAKPSSALLAQPPAPAMTAAELAAGTANPSPLPSLPHAQPRTAPAHVTEPFVPPLLPQQRRHPIPTYPRPGAPGAKPRAGRPVETKPAPAPANKP